MRERFESGIQLVAADEHAPLLLVGPATDLTGEVTLENPTAENVVIRNATLTLGGRACGGAGEVRAIVAPGTSRRTRLRVRLAEALPPGEYRGELTIAGRQYPAVIQVIELVRVEVTPPVLLVGAAPGAKANKRVVVTNRGNVAVRVGGAAQVTIIAEPVVDDDDPPRRAIAVDAPSITVQPGMSAALQLTLTLPEDLPKTRWQGVLPLATADLHIVVVPEPHKPRQPPVKKAPRKVTT